MLPNWLYGKSKSKLAELLGGGGTPSDYNQVKAQVTQNTEDITLLNNAVDAKINWSDYAQTGAINLLPIKCPSKTENNVTLTNNNDGSVTISGTASTNTYFYLLGNSRSHLEIIEGTGKSYTLSGCTSGSDSTYALRMLGSADLVAWYTVGQIQTTEGITFTEGAYPYYALRLDVFSGASVNVTIKPMLVDSKYNGPYIPYAPTNKEIGDLLTIKELDNALTAIKDLTFSINKAIRVGNIVEIDFQFTVNETDPIQGYTNIASMPTGYKPKATACTFVCFSNPNKAVFLTFRSDGNIQTVDRLSNGEIIRGTGFFICS